MNNTNKIDILLDDSPIDVSTEVNFIWSIANKLRGLIKVINIKMLLFL